MLHAYFHESVAFILSTTINTVRPQQAVAAMVAMVVVTMAAAAALAPAMVYANCDNQKTYRIPIILHVYTPHRIHYTHTHTTREIAFYKFHKRWKENSGI